jgi:hypothetical protein
MESGAAATVDGASIRTGTGIGNGNGNGICIGRELTDPDPGTEEVCGRGDDLGDAMGAG